MKLASQQTNRLKWLAWSTMGGIILYVMLVVVLHFLRPDYNPIFNAESDFGVGAFSFLMAIAFVLRGLLSFALFAGLLLINPPLAHARSGMIGLATWSVGSIILSIFPTDLEGVTRHTTHGAIHGLVAFLAFMGLLLAAFRLARSFRHADLWATLGDPLRIIAWLMLITFISMFLDLGVEMTTPGLGYFGLLERIFIALGLLWLFLTARRLQTTV
ncbi:MAG: DUF998 domain-containing protein [Ktedonobacteraceae bacterium]